MAFCEINDKKKKPDAEPRWFHISSCFWRHPTRNLGTRCRTWTQQQEWWSSQTRIPNSTFSSLSRVSWNTKNKPNQTLKTYYTRIVTKKKACFWTLPIIHGQINEIKLGPSLRILSAFVLFKAMLVQY